MSGSTVTFAEDAWKRGGRGRYVELNLVHDRGTLFSLRTGGRAESPVRSLPRPVKWKNERLIEAGTAESEATERYLRRRDWI